MASLFGFKIILSVDRSSRLEVFCKKGALKNFAKFTGKHWYGSLFYNKVAACKACNFIKKENPINVFSCGFHEIFKDTHREKAPSNKTPALTKSANMGAGIVGTSNRLFIKRFLN